MTDDRTVCDPRWRIRMPDGDSPGFFARLDGDIWSLCSDPQWATTWQTAADAATALRVAPPVLRRDGTLEAVP